jgi:tetratricopeptide (TPR) repeat protein
MASAGDSRTAAKANGTDSAGDRRLRGWKEIGNWLGVDERTVKRWEQQRGLPVHRVPGEARAPVYAFAAELARWMEAPEPAVEVPIAAVPPPSPRPRWPWVVLGALLAAVLAVALWPRPSVPLVPATARGQTLWSEGEYALSTRTRDGIQLANRHFAELARLEPQFAPGIARLAISYNMLAQYDLMPSSTAYARAVQLADAALAQSPDLPLAMAARGFAKFYGARDIEGAMADLTRAAAQPDANAEAHQWLALVSMHSGRQALALREIVAAERLDPKSRAIQANHGLILMHAGRIAEAEALLQRLRQLDPGMAAPPMHLASLYLASGRGAEHAAMLRALAVTRHNPALARRADALAAAFARGGMPALLAERRAQIAGDGEPFILAGAEAMLGNQAAALAQIDQALAADDGHLVGIMVEVTLAPLRRDPGFSARAARAGFTPQRLRVLAGEG